MRTDAGRRQPALLAAAPARGRAWVVSRAREAARADRLEREHLGVGGAGNGSILVGAVGSSAKPMRPGTATNRVNGGV